MLSPSELAPRLAWLLVVAMLAFAACSSDAAAPTTTEPTTSTAAEPTTTTAPSTTSTTASPSTAPPTSSEAEIQAELVRVLDGANSVFAIDPIDPDTPLIDEFYEAGFGQRVRANLLQDESDGLAYFGRFEIVAVESVELSGSSARVVACGLDGVGARSEDGVIVVEPDAAAFRRAYELERVDEAWVLAGVQFPGEQREECAAS